MANFTVKSQNLKGSEDNLDRMSQKLSTLQGRVNSIRYSLAFQVASSYSISSRLRAVADDINSQSRGMKNMSRGLGQSRMKYTSTENRICSKTKVSNGILGILNIASIIKNIPPITVPNIDWWKDLGSFGDSILEFLEFIDKPVWRPDRVFRPEDVLPGPLLEKFRDVLDRLNDRGPLDFSSPPAMVNKDPKIPLGDLILGGIVAGQTIEALIKDMEELKDNFIDKVVDSTTIKGDANASWKYWDASVEGEYGSAGVSVLAADAYASGEAGLMTKTEDGNLVFNPHIDAEAGFSVTALQADANVHVGDDMFGAQANGSVTVGEVSAKVSTSAGLFDSDGEFDPRLKASASAEAIAVEAKVDAGVTVLGTEAKVEAGVNVGVGAHADVGYEDGVLSLDIGASLGIGASIAVEIDFGGTIDAIKGKAKSILPWL